MKSDERSIRSYQLFQLLHLIHQKSVPFEEPVKIHASSHLGFPVADIENFLKVNGQHILELNVLSLFGVNSLLPSDMNLSIIRETNTLGQDFLNSIHQLFYELLYRAWLKYHPLFSIQSWYVSCLKALSAFTFNEEDTEAFYLARFFYRKTKNVWYLAQIVQQTIDEPNVRVKTFISTWQPLANVSRLNDNCSLRNNAVLGNRIFDASMTVAIYIQLQSKTKARQLLEGMPLHQKLIERIHQFLGPAFFYQVFVTVNVWQTKVPKLSPQKMVSLDGLTLLGGRVKTTWKKRIFTY